MSKYNNLSVDECRKELMNYISHKKRKDFFKELIAVFSYFIYLNDKSYLYNPPYLQEQFKKLEEFLDNSYEKWKLLNDMVEGILGVQYSFNSDEKLIISINDFLKIEFSLKKAKNNIELCENPSINGAICKKEDSYFRIEYYNNGLKKLRTYQYQCSKEKEIENNSYNLIFIVNELRGIEKNED